MNCNVHILKPARFHTVDQNFVEVMAGQIYSGTVREGYVTFHVTDRSGKIQQVKIDCKSDGIGLVPFKKHISK